MNPMDTAPRDGTYIRIHYRTTSGIEASGVYQWAGDCWASDGGDMALADDGNLIGWEAV